MSESTVNAIITAIGSLLGGIIGAYATIQAAKVKLPKSPNDTESKFPLLGIVIGTVIGAVATLGVLAFLGFVPMSTPKPTEPVITLTATPIEVSSNSVKRGNILFTEDFESGSADKFRNMNGLWRVVKDETGNMVYEIDNSGKTNDWPSTMFGSSSWKNYVIEYKIRILHYGNLPNIGAQVGFRSVGSDNLSRANYNLSLVPNNQGLWLGYGDDIANSYRMLASTDFQIEKNKWYEIRIETIGTFIRVFVNGEEELNTYDSELTTGSLGLRVGPDLQVQYDNILVTEITQ
jgi:hypothetical protein